ncbi:unnamed protein product [Allacma fusca]|uniref:Ionotropic glutamate receptor C-terminal domain-containing protein n=1 Tax=Allacma fusca TaxID=39272 RepID=A0A8J2KLH8_9HEXA|nr:unnamed protein product [Allacma fusca]
MIFMYMHAGSEPRCEVEVTTYSSVTLAEFLSDTNTEYSGDTLVIVNVAEFEISEFVNKLSGVTMTSQRKITCIIVFPEITTRIYRDLIMTPSIISYSLSLQVFLMEFNSLEKDDSGAHSALTWRLHHVFSSIRLQKFSLWLPLASEDIDRLVDVPGKFQNVSIKTAGVPFDAINPHLLGTRTLNGTFEFTGGFELELIRYLAVALNFSIIPIRGKHYVGLAKNGSLTGIGAQVATGEADISITSHEYIPYRQNKISYLHPTYSSPINAYIVRLPVSSFRDVFFNCCEVPVWLSLILFWVLSSILTRGFSWLKHRSGKLSQNDEAVGKDAILFVTGAACQQGWHISPDSVSMRLIVLASFITHIVFYATFTAALVSVLSVDQQLIHSSHDLTKYQYKMYSDGSVLTAEYIAHKVEGKSINDLSLVNRNVSTIDAFKKIYSGKAGLITFSGVFYPQLKTYFECECDVENSETKSQEKICKDIQQVSVTQVPLKAGAFLPKHSPLKPYFNQKIVLMMERGIRHRFLTIFFRNSVGQCGKAPTETVPIEFKDIWTAIMILLIGYFSSWMILLGERILSWLSFKNINL